MRRGSSRRFIGRPMYGELSAMNRLRGVMNGVDDVRVPGAAAQVAADAGGDLGPRWRSVGREELDGGHAHAGRATAGLHAVTGTEAILHRVQVAFGGKPFNRRDGGVGG